ADHEQPEMQFAEGFVHHPARNFGIPIVESSEKGEQDSANDHIVEVRNYKVRAAQLPVEGRGGQHDAGKPGDQELKQEADAEQHRSFENELATPHGTQPIEDFDSGGYSDDHAGE